MSCLPPYEQIHHAHRNKKHAHTHTHTHREREREREIIEDRVIDREEKDKCSNIFRF